LRRDDLAFGELVEPVVHVGGHALPAEQRGYTTTPEHLTEDARAAEYSAGIVLQSGNPRLHHRQYGTRQARVSTLGDGTNELLEVEGVAGGLLDDSRHGLAARRLTEHFPRELLARPWW